MVLPNSVELVSNTDAKISKSPEEVQNQLEKVIKEFETHAGDECAFIPDLKELETCLKDITNNTDATFSMSMLTTAQSILPSLKLVYDALEDADEKQLCAEIISVLAAFSEEDHVDDCVHYKLKGYIYEQDVDVWGHDFMAKLAENMTRWNGDDPGNRFTDLAEEVVPCLIRNGIIKEACELANKVCYPELLYTNDKEKQRLVMEYMKQLSVSSE